MRHWHGRRFLGQVRRDQRQASRGNACAARFLHVFSAQSAGRPGDVESWQFADCLQCRPGGRLAGRSICARRSVLNPATGLVLRPARPLGGGF
ncbi:hypothetical protein D3C76_1333270 [compost metagenome]